MSSVSVIIPCYNYGHYLPECVASVLSQDGVDVDVLIIDDCSADQTPDIGARLAAADRRVTFRRHDINLGHLATYNEGLEWASGDYTALLSADDLLVEDALSRAANVMDDHPNVGFVYGRSVRFSGPIPPAPRLGPGSVRIWPGHEWIERRCRTATNCISSPEVVVRTALQKRVGGYRPDLPHAGDLEMWLRLAAQSDLAHIGGRDQAFYRIHPDSMLRTTWHSRLADLRQRRAAFGALFSATNTLPNADLLREQVQRALAQEALWAACRGLDRRQLDPMEVNDLEAFALECSPRLRLSAVHVGLHLRKRLGPIWLRRMSPFFVGRMIRRVKSWLWWRRWSAIGV